jgi:hypothetical protein
MPNYKKPPETSLNMKRIGLIFFGMGFVFSSYSQKNLLQVERNVSEYGVDTTLFTQIEFCYSNTSDSAYVLWFEKDNVDSLSNFKKIRKHFFSTKGDMSLMQIIWDGNVGSFVPGLFDGFMKVIKPNEQFIVSILKMGKFETYSDVIESIEKQIVIVKANEITGLQIDRSIEMFNYSSKSITIFDEWLK